MSTPSFDAVVLAGGTGRRLGGASKPEVELEGRRLLDHALDATHGASAVVVVAPETVAVPAGVRRTLESPPLGGPAAGIAAGLAALRQAREPAPLILVLACDVPRAVTAVPALVAATVGSMADGACLVDSGGRRQWLVGVYRRSALERRFAAVAPDGAGGLGVGRLLEGLTLLDVPAVGTQALDVDTWGDLARARADRPEGSPDPTS